MESKHQHAQLFCPQNAYSHIQKQVSFGPRITGSESSKECAIWIVDTLAEFGAVNIQEQQVVLRAYNGQSLNAANISAQINPEAPHRVILLSHWDSRPWADQDRVSANRDKAIDGANDGASGVGVILELARVFALKPPICGIDLLLLDAEDYGQRIDHKADVYDEYSWCLGSQYWMEHPTLDLSRVDFAVLLDMVGGKDAVFFREFISEHSVGYVNDLVWQSARRTVFASRFPDSVGGAVIDDHVHFLLHHIPAIAIIESNHPRTGSFNPTWHTMEDTLENIDIDTLWAVGTTLERMFV